MHSFNLLKKAVIAAVALCSFTAASMVEAATWTITYPRPIDDSDARAQYPIALLKLALDKT
ncbi:MAG: amino acid ABC transporter substrate-binding protein, partial [Pseudomonadota bacterium]|nr:amino acid ABC transporter substrate-binding protein [Pseudomonadota bacterium]